ncbi:MAG TPA: response regulator transcription factor [Stellaceae bacterium]|nr:response regulator transcription factor [Stellaceae bacterium]
MSAVASAGDVPLRLRVAVAADDPAARLRLAELIALSGHEAVGATAHADAILTDGSATGSPGMPLVALGAAEGDFAGLLPGDAAPAQLDAALRAVAAGLTVRLPLQPQPGFASLPDEPSSPLTPREIEVLSALADGLGNKAVARRLGISPHTVKFHIESLFRKLAAATRAEAVAKGLRRQLVEF